MFPRFAHNFNYARTWNLKLLNDSVEKQIMEYINYTICACASMYNNR